MSDPFGRDTQDFLGDVATQREAGERELWRCVRQHVLGGGAQCVMPGEVTDLAVGDIGQFLQLRAPEGGVVE
ncbi:hypothetical protein D3C81_2118870 [compost metagenome]